jgi:hypothetical protein
MQFLTGSTIPVLGIPGGTRRWLRSALDRSTLEGWFRENHDAQTHGKVPRIALHAIPRTTGVES